MTCQLGIEKICKIGQNTHTRYRRYLIPSFNTMKLSLKTYKKFPISVYFNDHFGCQSDSDCVLLFIQAITKKICKKNTILVLFFRIIDDVRDITQVSTLVGETVSLHPVFCQLHLDHIQRYTFSNNFCWRPQSYFLPDRKKIKSKNSTSNQKTQIDDDVWYECCTNDVKSRVRSEKSNEVARKVPLRHFLWPSTWLPSST